MKRVYVNCVVKDDGLEPYSTYLDPIKTRRLSPMLQRALFTSLKCLKCVGVEKPDAIINGTYFGNIESQFYILKSVTNVSQDLNMASHFMYSTDSAVATAIAIYLGDAGYNSTYSQKNISFELAIQDAVQKIRNGVIDNALVCANDFIPDEIQDMMKRKGIVVKEEWNRSIAVFLSADDRQALEEIERVEIGFSAEEGSWARIKTRKINL